MKPLYKTARLALLATILGRHFQPLRAAPFRPPPPPLASERYTAVFEDLRRFYGTAAIASSFVADAFKGVTRDNGGTLRPRLVRAIANLSAAGYDNGRSRIDHGLQPAMP